MKAIILITLIPVFLGLTFAAWRRYLWVARTKRLDETDTCPYSLTEIFGESKFEKVPHQTGAEWLTQIFSFSAKKFPDLTALQIPHTGESLTFSELDQQAERVAAALSAYLDGPDQVVAVAMPQDNWQIVASHLGILKAGGTLMFLDTSLPEELITHMINDARPVVILTRGENAFRDLPTIDVLALPDTCAQRKQPTWLDDPAERLAAIFYTSGTTGVPRGVECPHAGYVNLALSYADYFDLIPGMDATSLTSSLGYDGSISEMYSAWVSGCAVVMLTKEQVRSGPELVPILCEAEVTVLFCPPVLLTTLTQNPEIDLPYPLCRYIVPAGEAFPAALVEPWTRNRRQIINTYGPTEASTDTSRQSLRPDETVTIGSPLPSVTYVVLEIGGLRPLPHGEEGELCIGGVHVARGYRNLPDQTSKKFITHPQFGRLYRTGDKCRIDGRSHRVHFLGRIDAQLKVRGHRVEAQAVEDILQTQFPEIDAAVLDYQNDALVAFVSAPSVGTQGISVFAPAPSDWAARVTTVLARQLPGPSVPTSIFLVEKFAMKAVSGKIDRGRLPVLSQLNGMGAAVTSDLTMKLGSAAEHAPKDMERELDEVLTICQAMFGTPLGLDDGFAESGGHSILIARLAQQLQAGGWSVPVRALLSDCNTARKIGARGRDKAVEREISAQNIKPRPSRNERDEAAAKVLPVWYFTGLQMLFLIFLYCPAIAAFIFLSAEAEDLGPLTAAAGFSDYILVSLTIYLAALATPFLLLLWVMIVKFFIGGDSYKNNVTPGTYPRWSKMHLRLWSIDQMQRLVLTPLSALYRSSPVRAFVLRQLGASVGKNFQCANDAFLNGPLDLLAVDDDVAVQTAAYIQTAGWSGKFVHVGPVRLGSECKIGMRATISCDVSVGEGAWVTPLTSVVSDVGPREVVEGAPSSVTGRCVELNRAALAARYKHPIWLLETVGALMQVFLTFWLTVFPACAILWAAANIIFAGSIVTSDSPPVTTGAISDLIGPMVLYAFSTAWLTVVVTSLLGCLFVRYTANGPGIYPAHGVKGALLMYRIAKLNSVQRRWTWTLTGQYLRALAGVRFRSVGASECDVMFNLVPEAVTADSQVFWSSGCYTNMLDVGARYFTLRRLDIPRNFFAGNNCVAEDGQFPSNFLLGVSTPASEIGFRRQMRSRPGEQVTVAGNPPVRFASSAAGQDESEKLPGFSIFLARVLLNDVFSVGVLPVIDGLSFAVLWLCFWRIGGNAILGAIAAFLLAEVFLVLLCIAVKKSMVGDKWGEDHSTPFWSLRHFAYFFSQDSFFALCGGPLKFFSGTLISSWILRRMGCTIGARTIMAEPQQCFDWNAVNFGSDCYIDGYLQLHTFEDMVLRVKRISVADECVVNVGSTLMGGASIDPGSTLLPLSLVLKEMNLSGGIYEGSPAAKLSTSTAAVVDFHAPPAASPAAHPPADVSPIVDKTDWLKVAAIVLVLVDHTGYFLMDNDRWWGVFGRLAAPVFFFLLGYANTRSVPIAWVLLGGILTLLESSNNDWTWVGPNILISFALIRSGRPIALTLIERYGAAAYAGLLIALVAVLPVAAPIVDYGAEGWLWALLGLSQRLYIDGGRSSAKATTAPASVVPVVLRTWSAALAPVAVCMVAAVVYVWQEQKEFRFSQDQWTVLVFGVALLTVCFCLFSRGPSRIPLPLNVARTFRFIGRRTLEIYVLELVAFELIIKLIPSLAP